MMEMVRSWLLGITGVAILSALAEELMPQGAVKQVGRLICGLVLLCVVVRPVMTLEALPLEQLGRELSQGTSARAEELSRQQQSQLKKVIEEQCAAYIVDKAKELGLFCTVAVSCEWDDAGIWLPAEAWISGSLSLQQQAQLEKILLEDLGISQDGVLFTEEEEA